MNVYVQPGTALIPTGVAPTNYSYMCGVDTSGQGEQVSIATAASSPRIDYIVAYIDKSVAGDHSGSVLNNTNSVLKLADVQGTPASSPSVPTTAQIQATINAANPYIILAQISVGASVNQITNPNITDMRAFAKLEPSNLDWTSMNVSFCASLSTQQNNVNGAVIALDTKIFDYGNNFNTSNYAFVAPVKGVYRFGGTIDTAIGTSVLAGVARTSTTFGNLTARGTWVENSGSFIASSVSCSLQLDVGDLAQLTCLQMGGTASAAPSISGQLETYLCGELVYRIP